MRKWDDGCFNTNSTLEEGAIRRGTLLPSNYKYRFGEDTSSEFAALFMKIIVLKPNSKSHPEPDLSANRCSLLLDLERVLSLYKPIQNQEENSSADSQ